MKIRSQFIRELRLNFLAKGRAGSPLPAARICTARDFSKPGKDAFHRVPLFAEDERDAVERVPTKTRTDHGAHGVTRPTGSVWFVALIWLCAQVSFAGSQWIVCPPGQALVKVPNQAQLTQNGIIQLELACAPAPSNSVLATTSETPVLGMTFNISVLPDSTFDPGGPLQSLPCSIEHDVLTNGLPKTQLACDPSYIGGFADPTNLASVQPPDPPPGTNINYRTRAATSIQQAALACLAQSTSFTSTQFLNSLGVSAQVQQWYAQGYRSDLSGLTRFNVPLIQLFESSSPSYMVVLQSSDSMVVPFLTGNDFWNASEEALH